MLGEFRLMDENQDNLLSKEELKKHLVDHLEKKASDHLLSNYCSRIIAEL